MKTIRYKVTVNKQSVAKHFNQIERALKEFEQAIKTLKGAGIRLDRLLNMQVRVAKENKQ
jgi:DNA-binding winged helix-turn-helix (wHTH) protein